MATTNLGRVRGLSAYEVWLAAGNEGDEAAYLAAIKGDKGDQGFKGDPGDVNVGQLNAAISDALTDWGDLT